MARKTKKKKVKSTKKKAKSTATTAAAWSDSNTSQVMTWLYLRLLGQISVVFPDAKDIKMSKLTFWNRTATGAARRLEAMAVSHQLMDAMETRAGATFNSNYTPPTALASLTDVAASADKTVLELASTVDKIFQFPA